MAVIRDRLEVVDGFSNPLDQYLAKMGKANQASLAQRDIEAEIEEIMTRAEREAAAAAEAKKREREEARAAAKAEREAARAAERRSQILYQQWAAQMAEQEAEAERQAAEAAEQSAQKHDRLTNVFQRLGQVMLSPIRAVPRLVSGFRKLLNMIAGVKSPMDHLISRLRMTALGFFTARRMITYIQNALKRATGDMADGITRMTTMIKDGFDRAVLSLVRGFLPAMDRLKSKLEENKILGQAFGQAMEWIGRGVGLLIDMVSQLVDWIGGHLNQALIIAGTLLALFAVKMLAAGLAAAISNAWLLALIGIVIGFAQALDATGVEAGSVFEKIAAGFGWLYAVIYNLVADIWNNALAPFAEAFATMLDHPAVGIAQLLVNLADFALSVLSKIAAGIDAMFGSNLAGAVNGWRSGLQSIASDLSGTAGAAGRMEYKNPTEVAKNWANKAGGIADSFSMKNLESYQLTELQDINANTGATAKKVDMAAEDLKAFVDMAERDYVMRVNLQQPNITVYGQNTGNSKEDREALADQLATVLAEMRASSPSVAVDYLYSGGY